MADESNNGRATKRGTIPTAALPKNDPIIYDPSPTMKTARTTMTGRDNDDRLPPPPQHSHPPP
jgi:hypothetical protein